ncbi:hypothetical protein T492DRAFT_874343, partial [Pavlovales sp. CCMP2436]
MRLTTATALLDSSSLLILRPTALPLAARVTILYAHFLVEKYLNLGDEQGLEDGVPLDQPYLEIDEAEWLRGGGGGGKGRGGGRKGRLRGRGVPGGQTDG